MNDTDIEITNALADIRTGVQTTLSTTKRNEQRIALLEEKAQITRKVGLGSRTNTSDFSISKAIVGLAGQIRGEDRWAEIDGKRERDILMSSPQRKALDSGTGGAGGGYVIPEEYLGAEFIEPLRANSVVMQAGAHLLTGLSGSPVRIPRQTASGTPYWVGENATITLSDATFGDVRMTPKTVAMRTQISNTAALLSVPGIDEIIMRDFAAKLALEIDRVALRGAGTLEPLGVANTPSIPTIAMGTDGGFLTWDDMLEIVGKVEDGNAMVAGGKYAFIMAPKIKRQLKKLKIPQYSGDLGGQYLLPPTLSDAAIKDMLGYDLWTSTQVRTDLTKGAGTNLSEVYFGNWDDLYIAQWGSVEILATSIGGNAWAQNAVEIRLVFNTDVALRNLESIVYLSDVRTI